MAVLPRDGSRSSFQVGDVVSLDRVAYAHLTRGPGALVEMAARRLPQIVGQVSKVDGPVVEVIWENGRMVAYSDKIPYYTTTEVLNHD